MRCSATSAATCARVATEARYTALRLIQMYVKLHLDFWHGHCLLGLTTMVKSVQKPKMRLWKRCIL
jgi:hypothetical protein